MEAPVLFMFLQPFLAMLDPIAWAMMLMFLFAPFAMALRLGTAARNAACNAVVDLIDGGSGAGLINIYTNAQVTNVGDSEGGNTLLGTLTFTDPAFGNAATGVATASAITSDTNADNSGTAGHATITTSDPTTLMDCTCGQGSGDINFDNNVIVAGGTIAITSMTVTQPI
jgi:hypothetical protein